MKDRTRRFAVEAPWNFEQVRDLLPGGLELHAAATELSRVWHLDTFDWRVFTAGAFLELHTVRGGTKTLRFHAAGEHPYVVPVDRVPRFAGDLPPGLLTLRLPRVLEMRALLEVGETVLEQRPLAIGDDDGNTLARVWLEHVTVLDHGGESAEVVDAVRVEGLAGHEELFATVVRALADRTCGELPAHDLARAAAARGRRPGDYSSKPRLHLDPTQPAGEGARVVLLHLHETMVRNMDGVLDDLDTEFLHDFRVAVRRTRSVLGQLRHLFAPGSLQPFRRELKWLGEATGSCRDLDVFLLEMEHYRTMLPLGSTAALGPLEEHLVRVRTEAHAATSRALRSSRCSRFLASWSEFLHGTGCGAQAPPEALHPIGEVAAERIRKAYRRIVSKGGKLGDDPAPEALHRLRLDAKKMRYLLELFRSLYRGTRGDRLVKELKRIQDVLGGFNDMEVQQLQLVEHARELAREGPVPAETLMAMGRLQTLLGQRQEELRLAFAARFSRFASPEVERRLQRYLVPKSGKGTW